MQSKEFRTERSYRTDELLAQLDFMERTRSELAEEETKLANRIQYVIVEQERIRALVVLIEKELEVHLEPKRRSS